MYLATELLLFFASIPPASSPSYPLFCVVRLDSESLSAANARQLRSKRIYSFLSLFLSPFALYAANRQRLAYPKIIDHTNSRGDTWPDLHRYHLISGDLFPEARVISILDSKNSGVSYGSANKIIRIETGNYLTNSSAYRAIKRRGRPDADAISPLLFFISLFLA